MCWWFWYQHRRPSVQSLSDRSPWSPTPCPQIAGEFQLYILITRFVRCTKVVLWLKGQVCCIPGMPPRLCLRPCCQTVGALWEPETPAPWRPKGKLALSTWRKPISSFCSNTSTSTFKTESHSFPLEFHTIQSGSCWPSAQITPLCNRGSSNLDATRVQNST